MKLVVVLTSSPRRHGNTNTLTAELLRGLTEAEPAVRVEQYDLARLNIRPCTQCDFCRNAGNCVRQDDMQLLYPLLTEADWMVLAAPIYYMAHCAQAKLFIDRCQAFWSRRYVLKQPIRPADRGPRRGVFISAGATRGKKVFEGALVTMRWLYDSLEMEAWRNLVYEQVDAAGAIREHPDALATAYETGREMHALMTSPDAEGTDGQNPATQA